MIAIVIKFGNVQAFKDVYKRLNKPVLARSSKDSHGEPSQYRK